MRYIFNTLIFILLLVSLDLVGQDFRGVYVGLDDNGKILSDYLKEVEVKYSVDIVFDEEKIRAITIMNVDSRKQLVNFLREYLVNFIVLKASNDVVLIWEKNKFPFSPEEDLSFTLINPTELKSNVITGKIIESEGNKALENVHIKNETTGNVILSESKGSFSLEIQGDVNFFSFNSVGFDVDKRIVLLTSKSTSTELSVVIYPESEVLDEVMVTSNRGNERIISPLVGVEEVNLETIKTTPPFLGEVDPIRSITTLPGVSTAGELASGFNVRGGETGQNLVIQDGGLILNPSHLFGFFSAFNPDLVSTVTLYKGNPPAYFGGRVSSVLDVGLRSGNLEAIKVTGGVGLVSSRLAIEGPIKKKTSSFILGGRISYCNWLVNSTKNIQLEKSKASFYDLTAKFYQKLNKSNYLTFSFYKSNDNFRLASDSIFSWGTENYSLSWDKIFNETTSSNLRISNSYYFSAIENLDQISSFDYINKNLNTTLKYTINKTFGEKLITYTGLEIIKARMEPGKLNPSNELSNSAYQNMEDHKAVEMAVFGHADWSISERVEVSTGLRFSTFYRLGSGYDFVYDYANKTGRYPLIVDTLHFDKNSIMKNYSGFEPRFSMRYKVSESFSIKAAYGRSMQYVHLISNTTTALPQDYWIASGSHLKPEIASQVSLGVFKYFTKQTVEVSLESYYKSVSNIVDYVDGADISLNPSLEGGLANGLGVSYGLEFFLKKSEGRFNGWVSYTYARSFKKINDTQKDIVINDGKYYASQYDQPNKLSVVMSYNIAPKVKFSINYNYSTGRPITIPISKFTYDVYLSVLNYSKRNDYRIPDYHRMDLSITFLSRSGYDKKVKGEWVFSVFNVYGRKNAYSIYFDRYGSAHKLSILGTVFPSLSYNFKF